MEQCIIYVGLDVHKDTIAVALAEAGLREEVREHGKIPNTPAALKALTAKLAGKKRELRFCYEAGPCGYGIQRQLSAMRARMCRGRSVVDPAQTRRSDQNGPTRCDQPRQAAPRG